MAPMSRMLVYYVKNDGEGVADSINLLVTPKLENEVIIDFWKLTQVFVFDQLVSPFSSKF